MSFDVVPVTLNAMVRIGASIEVPYPDGATIADYQYGTGHAVVSNRYGELIDGGLVAFTLQSSSALIVNLTTEIWPMGHQLLVQFERPEELENDLQIARDQAVTARDEAVTAQAAAEAAETAAELARDEAEQVFVNWRQEAFDGDGSTTGFTLELAPGSPYAVFPVIGGVLLTTGYSIDPGDPKLIVFDSAPASGTGNVVIRYGRITNGAADGEDGADGTSFVIKGEVADIGSLPGGATAGDAYRVGGLGGDIHVWTGSAYLNLGPIAGPAPFIANETQFNALLDDRALTQAANLADILNAVVARANLGVAQKPATLHDTTSGLALIVGSGGMMAAAPSFVQAGSTIASLDSWGYTGFARVQSGTALAAAAPLAVSGMVASQRWSATNGLQTYMSVDRDGPRDMFRVQQTTWGQWFERWHSGNTIALGLTAASARAALAVRGVDYVMFEDFGAVGDGITNDGAAIAAARDTLLPIRGGGPTKTYRIEGAINFQGRGAHIDGQGCKFLMADSDASLRFTGGWANIQAVTAITYNASHALITVTNGALITPGMVLKIVNEEAIDFHPSGASAARKGEFVTAQFVTGNVVQTAGPLFYNYDLGSTPRIGQCREDPFVLENFGVSAVYGIVPVTRHDPLIEISDVCDPQVSGIRVGMHYEAAIKLNSVFGGVFTRCSNRFGANQAEAPWTTNGAPGIDGDVFEVQGCHGTIFLANYVQNCRHGVTTNSAAGDAAGLRQYGVAVGVKMIGNVGSHCTNPPFVCHEGSRNTEILHNRSMFCKRNGFSFRGVNTIMDGNVSFYDRNGVAAFVGSAYLGTSLTQHSTWRNGHIINPREAAFLLYDDPGTISIEGGCVELLGGNSQDGVTFTTTAVTLIDMQDEATVNIRGDFTIRARQANLASLTSIIRSQAAGSKVVIESMCLDTDTTSLSCPFLSTFSTATAVDRTQADIGRLHLRQRGGDAITYLLTNAVQSGSRLRGGIENIAASGAADISSSTTLQALMDAGQIIGPIHWGGLAINPPPASSIAAAPKYKGQVAMVGTTVYIAVGTATTGDWKAVTLT